MAVAFGVQCTTQRMCCARLELELTSSPYLSNQVSLGGNGHTALMNDAAWCVPLRLSTSSLGLGAVDKAQVHRFVAKSNFAALSIGPLASNGW